MPLGMFLNKGPHHRPPCLSMKKLQQSSQIPGSQLKASIQAILFYAYIKVQGSKCIVHQTFMHYMVVYLSQRKKGSGQGRCSDDGDIELGRFWC